MDGVRVVAISEIVAELIRKHEAGDQHVDIRGTFKAVAGRYGIPTPKMVEVLVAIPEEYRCVVFSFI